jgi:WD40 repeat protein
LEEYYGFSWSADGKRMACCNRCRIEARPWEIAVWELDTGKQLRHWKIFGDVALAPDGESLAVHTADSMILLDVASAKELRRWKSAYPGGTGGTGAEKRFAFSPDGKIIASTENGQVTLWNPVTGQLCTRGRLSAVLSTGQDTPVTVAFSGNSRYLAAGCAKGSLYVWDLVSGKAVPLLPEAAGGPIYVLNFAADGKTLVCQPHRSLSARLWDVTRGQELSPKVACANAAIFSPDGKTVALAPGPVSLWDVRSGRFLRSYPFYGEMPAFLPGGKAMALSTCHYLTVWNLKDGKLRYQTKGKGPFDNVTPGVNRYQGLFAQCCLDDNRLVAVFPGDVKKAFENLPGSPTIRWAMIGWFDIRTGEIVRSFPTNTEDALSKVFLSPDRKSLVAFDSGNAVFAWDLHKGVELFRLTAEDSPISVSFSADSRTLLLTCRAQDFDDQKWTIHLYEMASGKKRATVVYKVDSFTRSGNFCRTCAAISGEHLVAISQEDQIQLFDVLLVRELARFKNDGPCVDFLSFSPDGKCLLSASDTTALIWDVSHMIPPLEKVKLTSNGLSKAWANLLNDDAKSAFRSIRHLSQAPEQTVAFLEKSLQPMLFPPEKIAPLIKQLDSPRFPERKQASEKLLDLGEAAEAPLLDVLKKPVSLETRRRAEEILQKTRQKSMQGPFTLSGEPLRLFRAVEILERIGTPAAATLLANLAKGSRLGMLARAAQASHQRLTMRSP